jgi:hypothetical protein
MTAPLGGGTVQYSTGTGIGPWPQGTISTLVCPVGSVSTGKFKKFVLGHGTSKCDKAKDSPKGPKKRFSLHFLKNVINSYQRHIPGNL